MLYSDVVNEGVNRLRAYFQPQTLGVIQDFEDVDIEITVGPEDPVRISNYEPDDYGCVEFYYFSIS